MIGKGGDDFLSSHSDSFDDEFCKLEMEQEDDGGSDRLQIDTPDSSLSNELYEEEIRAEFQSEFEDDAPGDETTSSEGSEYEKNDKEYELEDMYAIAMEESDYITSRDYGIGPY
ncbi:Oidioi.mRNA.OKI2018_I69.PAR.g9108.t1.cds [Oikopleura dioica]|uniref:Oidioi.mRNA.OKI2018_I69.PAR.g9108.t1.cds n=1 Tax=Oikopleura dioica TaxID=34765 RepID=A0ABN7RJ07_OIKDI|nr:Oidioi.mRNA.OKI2018_I69.PAR.g9108.t1.cds [Oikopleura dioica]